MRLRELAGATALEACAADYDALCDAVRAPVTARRAWLQTWADCYPDWEPWVFVVDDAAGPVAAAALARSRRAGFVRVVGLGHGPSDEARLPAVDQAAAVRLADGVTAALGRLGRPWQLHVEQLPPADPAPAALAARLPVGRVVAGDGMPQITVHPSRELRRHVSRNTRSALAKARNRIAAAGLEERLVWTSDPAAIAAAMPELAAVHRARDHSLGRRSDHDDPRAARFHREVLLRHARAGEVELLTLRLGDRLAAYVAAFCDGAALRVWDNRLEPSFAHLSAGRIANAEAVAHVVADQRYAVLDWMRGEESYKLSNATTVVPTCDVWGFSSRVAELPYRTWAAAKARKDSTAALDQLWRRLNRLPSRG